MGVLQAFRLRRSRRAHDGNSSLPVSPQHAAHSRNSTSNGEGTTLDRAGSASSSSSDTDATEQRVQGSMIAAEDIEFCRHADGTPWLLGSGPHGQVYKALRGGVQEVAVKVLQRTSGKRLHRLIDEVGILKGLNYDGNIVQFYGACIREGADPMLVTEFMEGGDLGSALAHDELGQLQWHSNGRTLALDLARALYYLHSNGVVHGNIKARNVLLSRELDSAKLSTSGLAHLLGKRAAPRNAAGDVAAFGNCLWLMVVGCARNNSGRLQPPTPEDCPGDVWALIQQCTSSKPAQRPTAKECFARLRAACTAGCALAPATCSRSSTDGSLAAVSGTRDGAGAADGSGGGSMAPARPQPSRTTGSLAALVSEVMVEPASLAAMSPRRRSRTFRPSAGQLQLGDALRTFRGGSGGSTGDADVAGPEADALPEAGSLSEPGTPAALAAQMSAESFNRTTALLSCSGRSGTVNMRRAVSDNLDDIGGFKISGGPDGMVMSVTAGSQSADSLQAVVRAERLRRHQVRRMSGPLETFSPEVAAETELRAPPPAGSVPTPPDASAAVRASQSSPLETVRSLSGSSSTGMPAAAAMAAGSGGEVEAGSNPTVRRLSGYSGVIPPWQSTPQPRFKAASSGDTLPARRSPLCHVT